MFSFFYILGPEKVSNNAYDLRNASRDESSLEGCLPILIVYPDCVSDVKKIVKIALQEKIPLTARGSGTSLEGSSIPLKGGVVVDFSKMNRILSLQPENMLVVVEPGIIYKNLNDKIRHTGLFFPPSPGGSSDTATIGGMVATNASGIYAFRYGSTRDYLLEIEGVTGGGDFVRAGNHSRKSSSGYSILNLLCGSEGTLALFTSITLRLAPLPQFIERLTCSFGEIGEAVEAAQEICASVIDLAAIELVDSATMDAASGYVKSKGSAEASLFIEVHSTNRNSIEDSVKVVGEIVERRGGSILHDPSLWQLRGNLTKGIKALYSDMKIVRVDASVPTGTTADFYEFSQKAAQECGVKLFAFGHIGTGVIHFLMPVKSESFDSEEIAGLRRKIIMKALELRGSISGEHGIGLGNREYMVEEHSNLLCYMREIKKIFDPENILNPDKIFLE